MTNQPQAANGRTYQIGTVSSLTGIDAHTIRAWERRYGAIKPNRSETGRRLYDDETVERLQLLKGLVDCNEAIGQIAHLADGALRKRLEKLAEYEDQASRMAGAPRDPARRPRVALLAPSLSVQIRANAVSMADLELRVFEDEPERFIESLLHESCEIVLLEVSSVDDDALRRVQACLDTLGHPHVMVLYRFAPRVALARLARAGASLVRMPIRLESLRRVILDQVMIRRAHGRRFPTPHARPSTDARTPAAKKGLDPIPRRFDDAQLSRLLELTSAVDCECPNHLSSVIAGLVAFEEYSRTCESKDELDAEQHLRLARGTGEARARMEELLIELCEHEGISV